MIQQRQEGNQPAAHGGVTLLFVQPDKYKEAADHGLLIRDDDFGHYWKPREKLLYEAKDWSEAWQKQVLAWLRDNVNSEIPRAYYRALLGHDLHVSIFGELYLKHFHADLRDPFTGRYGWLENVGLASRGKVTTAFRDFEALMLVTDATTQGDFKFHRPGTSAAAEDNTQTALTTDAGLEATGNQSNPSSSTYQSVATVTADTTETWQEHSIRNATGAAGGTMLDRSVLSPTAAVNNLDTVQFTYVLTKNAEA